jgi:PTS system nitrogen regulatory IIA component
MRQVTTVLKESEAIAVRKAVYVAASKQVVITPMPQRLGAIAQHLWPEDILLDIKVANKDELFEVIGRHMEREHAIPCDRVISGLSRRERVGSTGLGEGIAIPHARVESLTRIHAVYLHIKTPISYDAPDGQSVSDVLVLLVPKQATEEHLLILADATQMFADYRFRQRLRACNHPIEVKSLFESQTR